MEEYWYVDMYSPVYGSSTQETPARVVEPEKEWRPYEPFRREDAAGEKR